MKEIKPNLRRHLQNNDQYTIPNQTKNIDLNKYHVRYLPPSKSKTLLDHPTGFDMMTGSWFKALWSIFDTNNGAEKVRKENAKIDREIESKKLEIKKLKSLLRERKEDKFHRRMEKLPAKIKEINISGLSRTSDE